MTRKKFVKQLMALGIPRNNAESFARWCAGSTFGYKDHLADILARERRERERQGGGGHD